MSAVSSSQSIKYIEQQASISVSIALLQVMIITRRLNHVARYVWGEGEGEGKGEGEKEEEESWSVLNRLLHSHNEVYKNVLTSVKRSSS